MRSKPNPPAKPAFISRQVAESNLFFLNLKAHTGRGARVVCGGWEHCRGDYRIERQDFLYYCLEFVSSGSGLLKLADGAEVELQPGSVFLYGPGVPHRIVAAETDPPVKYFVDFTGTDYAEKLSALGLPPGTFRQAALPRLIRQVFDDLIRHGQDPSPGREPACRAVLEHLLVEVARGTVPQGAKHSRAWSNYQRCRDVVREQFIRLNSLADISNACHVEKAYLCRLFKRFSEISPYEYLTQLKMEYAAELLRQSDVMVKEVADELGFANPYHFSRVFKKVHGLPPNHFCRLARQDGPRET